LLFKKEDGVPERTSVTREQVDAAQAEVERLTKAVKREKKRRKRRQAQQAHDFDPMFDGSSRPRDYGTNQPTRAIRTQNGAKLSKSERKELARLSKLESTLTEISKMLLREDLTVSERAQLRKAQGQAYRALVDAPVAKSDGTEALALRAERIAKDEGLTTYEAMRAAFTPEAQRAYLASVR
jgi:hypothetical protein